MSQNDRSGGVLAVVVAFFAFTWMVVPLRIYVRAVLTKAFGLDDILLIITQVKKIFCRELPEKMHYIY